MIYALQQASVLGVFYSAHSQVIILQMSSTAATSIEIGDVTKLSATLPSSAYTESSELYYVTMYDTT